MQHRRSAASALPAYTAPRMAHSDSSDGGERHSEPHAPPAPTNVPARSSRPPRARHPKLAAARARLIAAPPIADCVAPPPPALLRAIEQFNANEFFDQHESLERLWLDTPGTIRHAYEGILQIGVGLYHLLERRNFHGAAVKLDHGIRLLDACPPVCHGLDLARLRGDARSARRHLLRLGPDRLAAFNRARVPKVHFVGET